MIYRLHELMCIKTCTYIYNVSNDHAISYYCLYNVIVILNMERVDERLTYYFCYCYII